MRYMVEQKTEIQGIQEKIELLENQKLNSDTLQSVAGQLATNTVLIRGLVDWREKIEENESKLEQLERDLGDQVDAVRGIQAALEKSRVDMKDELTVAVSDLAREFGVASREKSEELSSRIQLLSDETEKHVTHILSELGNFKKLGDKVDMVEKGNSLLHEKISHLSNWTEANKEEVLLKLATLEKDSVNKGDMEVITGQLEALELGQKKLTRADIVQTSDRTTEDKKLSSLAELDGKMTLLERQWSEYSTNALLEAKIEQLEKQREGDLEVLDKLNEDLNSLQHSPTHIEELRKNDNDQKTSIEKCSSEIEQLSSRIEKLVQMLDSVQEQVKESTAA